MEGPFSHPFGGGLINLEHSCCPLNPNQKLASRSLIILEYWKWRGSSPGPEQGSGSVRPALCTLPGESQHSGGRGRRISVSSRPAWSARASSRTGSKATEKPCLEKQNKTKQKTTKKERKKEMSP
ncbi:hypothetical protein LEMLEM_LOCUS20997, partial [Lemmus lemmus]